jgi:putative endonuclease
VWAFFFIVLFMKEFFVYAIRSLHRNYIYVGLTDNLERRIQEHNHGKGRSTKPYAPFQLIYSEKVGSREEARIREKYLKSGSGKEFLKNIK